MAIILFGVGGGISLYEGIIHLQHPAELSNPSWNYLVLGLAVIFESVAFTIAFRALVKVAGKDNIWQAVRESKDPTIFVVLFEDAAALAGLLVAFLGVFLSHQLEMPILDAVSSLIIAVILMAVAVYLAYESRNLLLGEAADPDLVRSIEALVSQEDAIRVISRPMTMHFGPKEVLLNMDLSFQSGLTTREINDAVERVERQIRTNHPQVKRIFLEARALKKITNPA